MQNNWARKQIASVEQAYAKAPHLAQFWLPIKTILEEKHDTLVSLNVAIIREMGRLLGCTTPLYLASELPVTEADPTQRLIALTRHFDGDTYLSGSEGRNYLDGSAFTDAELSLLFQNVTPPTYPQLHGPFIPYLSALDVLLNMGKDAKKLILEMGDMQI